MSNANCDHSVVINNICTECNMPIDSAILERDYVRADPNNNVVMISPAEAKRRNLKEEQNLIAAKKLSLVIDLDKTLIDTVEIRNTSEIEAIKKLDPGATEDDFLEYTMNQILLIRYRPYVREFLASIAPYFDMQIYTLATPHYAHQIINKIDPDSKLFKNRIFSRTAEDQALLKAGAFQNPNEMRQRKNIKKIFPYSDKLVLVLDDSPDVWFCDDDKIFKGLVQIKRYSYFKKDGPGFPATVNADFINDDILQQMRSVLLEVHDMFFKDYDPEQSHVIMTLQERKMRVFAHKVFYFSGLTDDDRMIFTRLAEEYGALVVDSYTPYTTHVIIGDSGADSEAQKALNYKGVYIVYVKWVLESFLQYASIDEAPLAVVGFPCPTIGQEDIEEPPEAEISSSDLDFDLGGDDDEQEKPTVTKVTFDDIKDDPNWMEKVMEIETDGEDEEEDGCIRCHEEESNPEEERNDDADVEEE